MHAVGPEITRQSPHHRSHNRVRLAKFLSVGRTSPEKCAQKVVRHFVRRSELKLNTVLQELLERLLVPIRVKGVCAIIPGNLNVVKVPVSPRFNPVDAYPEHLDPVESDGKIVRAEVPDGRSVKPSLMSTRS